MHMHKRLVAALVLLFVTVGLSEHAHAYVDLGTGSYMLQLLVAGMFGMIFAAKSLWAKMRLLFSRPSKGERQS
jgi:hypothetical protein